ncbi:2-hydroxychromene-2-carboxylate isomerase [Pseudoduganella sp. FT26W]|uniref:2-hydroxychromene-2-carboxylate isomerase n=1 Tax=Duganella aquatilis TaxID=2666082 RepID=A0A844CTJ9_9BURK|nr:2-hydroxychromene-2-carboxylate isomerase [Duganella aquatilis]MRW83663.1 2-hydroxychromene-2-carboxylate isomerase [Duganella aquatilis]
MPASEIACWFDFASTYSYVSVLRLARQRDVIVQWKPFLLGPIFKEQGWDNSPFVLQKDKGDYMWMDMARECAKYGLPWRQPSEFPRRSLLAARVALLGEHQPWMAEFCARTMLANFEHDEDIGSSDCIAAILTSIGLDAATLLAAAQSDDNKARLRARSEEAKSRHLFGAPTFFVDNEMYWGNDRLSDALAKRR